MQHMFDVDLHVKIQLYLCVYTYSSLIPRLSRKIKSRGRPALKLHTSLEVWQEIQALLTLHF